MVNDFRGWALGFVALWAGGLSACGSASTPTPPSQPVIAAGLNQIQHIVIIVKENRTFDNYFGTFPGADGATSGIISNGRVISLGHESDRTPRDPGHTWQSALTAINGGQMNQFDLIQGGNVGRLSFIHTIPPGRYS